MGERFLAWPTSAGPVVLRWDDDMAPDEAAAALEAVMLACRSIQKIAHLNLPAEAYGRAMKDAMETTND